MGEQGIQKQLDNSIELIELIGIELDKGDEWGESTVFGVDKEGQGIFTLFMKVLQSVKEQQQT